MNTNVLPDSKLSEFFVTSLQELYWSEINLINVLTTMSNAATAEQLQSAFETHRDQTKGHAQRLEEIFTLLALPLEPVLCMGLQGLFDEGWQVIDETEPGSSHRDVALIIAAQKVEHYEIACYGSLVTLARTLGQREITGILSSILQEEKETDLLLTRIAESDINEEAGQEAVQEQKS